MERYIKSIVIFGIGKIGLTFVGQLFSTAGYQIVFVDIDKRIIEELNRRGKYEIVIKSKKKDETIEVTNASGVLTYNESAASSFIAHCSLIATCVSKNALSKTLPAVAKGINKVS